MVAQPPALNATKLRPHLMMNFFLFESAVSHCDWQTRSSKIGAEPVWRHPSTFDGARSVPGTE
jgi:hypothetical protein